MRFIRWTAYLFALRVPLACLAALVSLAPLGAFPFSPFRAMLEGLFDVSGWGAFWASAASWLSASAVWTCASLVLDHGPRRIAGLPRSRCGPRIWLAWCCALAPASILAGICAVSGDRARVLAGSAAGCAALAAAWLAYHRLCPRPFPWTRRLMRWDPAGYRNDETGELAEGHWLAAQFTVFFLALWACVGYLEYARLCGRLHSHALPTSLTYAILLAGLLALSLSGLAFFFDRYRVPVLLPWLALLSVASLLPDSGHVVDTQPARAELVHPAAAMSGLPTPVLVCASGGGIAAAAWTATVLSQLDHATAGRLTSSLALFSGASGGSVGGMHFLASGGREAGALASRSSLNAAAWGLVGPDFARALLPFAGVALGRGGRGWALEQSWDPEARLRAPISALPAPPGVVFNATVVETGEGAALGNVNLEPLLAGMRSLSRRGEPRDVSIVGAARLSASFPYVTPAAEPRPLGYHLADGGYYDNYGVSAAVAFLHLASQAAPLPPRILLIEIRAQRSHPGRGAPARPGALFQLRAPALTVLNVRGHAQRRRNDLELDLLSAQLAARGSVLLRVAFEIPRDEVPLSWHLTQAQRAALAGDWRDRYERSPEVEMVKNHFDATP